MAAASLSPVPHTVHPNEHHQQYQQSHAKPDERHVNFPPPPPPRSCFSPQLTRDHYQSLDDENAAIHHQVRNLSCHHDFLSQYKHDHTIDTCFIFVRVYLTPG